MKVPNVYFVTLGRSDYSTIRPIVRAAMADSKVDAKLIVGGGHLLTRHGHSISQIEEDGFSIHTTVDFLSERVLDVVELAHSYERAISHFVRIFSLEQPDYVFVVGDRWEMLAVVSASSLLQIPVIHHSGGDITQGSADNQIRYAITNLSHLHLVALDQHRERLLKLGEEDWRVITSGEPALTELETYASAVSDIQGELGIPSSQQFVLATFHPTSFDVLPVADQIEIYLQILDCIQDPIVITAPNADAGSDLFLQKIKEYVSRNERVRFVENLGSEKYYAAMSQALYMMGNSSSGMWESSSFGLPVLNIGNRQSGRVHGENVVNVPLQISAIREGIEIVASPQWREKSRHCRNPYLRKDTIDIILTCLKAPWDRSQLLAKKFIDPLAREDNLGIQGNSGKGS
ncbi:MAG: UDP-N-acetylglucosamine 2-epimerase (hydrolyzing) [Bdellovibrionales bacterium]|nr:UDP-N-acetylglucosamine 2-epimerase (hydrolyzing) [Bdellovibrionales bacterium]